MDEIFSKYQFIASHVISEVLAGATFVALVAYISNVSEFVAHGSYLTMNPVYIQ